MGEKAQVQEITTYYIRDLQGLPEQIVYRVDEDEVAVGEEEGGCAGGFSFPEESHLSIERKKVVPYEEGYIRHDVSHLHGEDDEQEPSNTPEATVVQYLTATLKTQK